MKVLLWLCMVLGSAILTIPAFTQQRSARIALVIGNASYPDASPPLSSTISDVRALAAELRRHDFMVEVNENVGKLEMQDAIDASLEKIQDSTAALFYFSGYGIQVDHENYLIPINAQIWSEDYELVLSTCCFSSPLRTRPLPRLLCTHSANRTADLHCSIGWESSPL